MRQDPGKRRWPALLLIVCMLLVSCGSAPPREDAAGSAAVHTAAPGDREPTQDTVAPGDREPAQDPAPTRDREPTRLAVPPMATSTFHEDKAVGASGVLIDMSAVSEGYVALSAVSDKRLKFQVLKDDQTYTYNLSSEGVPSIFPLQCGDGRYTFRALENIGESRYAVLYITECDVKLIDEFQPYLRPNDYVGYSAQSECVRRASRLAAESSDALEFIASVYKLICGTVTYDTDKAAGLKSMYLPDVDETLLTGRGICFDYASLAAAMLRSQGIPTKLIFGYVSPDDLYHAWNMFYTEQSGWITVSFEVGSDSWNRIDLTFSAGGAPDEFVGDGSHYTEVYSY